MSKLTVDSQGYVRVPATVVASANLGPQDSYSVMLGEGNSVEVVASVPRSRKNDVLYTNSVENDGRIRLNRNYLKSSGVRVGKRLPQAQTQSGKRSKSFSVIF